MSHPEDWPQPGPIDLAIHDLPHRSSSTEWWYVNSHFTTGDGREFSVFAAFFQILRRRDEQTGEREYAHTLTWGICDPSRERYLAESWVDHHAPEVGLERLDHGRGTEDDRLNRAMREVLVKGRVPLPDQMFDVETSCSWDALDLRFGNASFHKAAEGRYRLSLWSEHHEAGCELELELAKPVVRHGEDGVVRGSRGEDMFYYFVPRCRVSGALRIDGDELPVARGQGWYDHEFGGYPVPEGKGSGQSETDVSGSETASDGGDAAAPGAPDERNPESDIAWNWAAIQLDDGRDVTVYTMVDIKTDEVHGQGLIVVDQDGGRQAWSQLEFEPLDEWRSTRTFFPYPIRWRVRCEGADLDLDLTASFSDQELMTVLSKPAFWEGRCGVAGTLGGEAVSGLAFIERSGFEPLKNLDDFFGAVGIEVRRSVGEHLPTNPTWEETRDMIASEERSHYMDGVDPDALARAMADPVRLITDRGGKSWRSYAALACCDVVGGDSRRWVRWLAMPEFMHVGSLIVDDVQDRSEWRRGGPACHVVYGDALAINSGTACYFMGHNLLFGDDVSDEIKLRLYDLYFEALRAGHAGQAIDLSDKAPLIEAAVESGDSAPLEARILAGHRLKTAAPAAALARMGALVGGGTEEQIEGVGRFFEALGLAFQIIDDVLNVRGFRDDLKDRAEDVRNGTTTILFAKALGRLGPDERRWLADTLASRPDDADVVARFVELMESCGAVQDAADEATELVETAWKRVDPLLRDSFPKLMLRAFSWYVLERHY